MARWQPIVVVGMAVLAGCSGLGVAPGPSATDTPTVTPVPVPGETTPGTATSSPTPVVTAPTGETLPPGLTSNGSLDVDRLLAGHTEATSGRSYWYRTTFERRQGGPSGRLIGRSNTTVRVESSERYLVTIVNDDRRREFFVDRSGEYFRRVIEGEVVTLIRNPDPLNGPQPYVNIRTRFFPDNVSSDAVQVTPIERNGVTYYRLHVTKPPLSLDSEAATIQNYTSTIYVRADGLIQLLTVTYDAKAGNVRTHYHRRFVYRDIGETTVSTPQWVRQFKANRTATDGG